MSIATALASALSACGGPDQSPVSTATSTTTAAAGTTAPISSPPAPVVIPDVRGERPLAADHLLDGAGLHAHITGGTGRGPGGGQCVVTEQHPDAGTVVSAGTTVELGTGETGGSGTC